MMISYVTICLYIATLFEVTASETICHCTNCDHFPQSPCHSGCEDNWYGRYCQQQNIAQGKTTTQSSELNGYGCPCPASRAVDGGKNNNGLRVLVDDKLCFTSTKTYSERLSEEEQKLHITCNPVLSGRTVTVQVTGPLLTLCEVQVFVCSDGWFGESCDIQCQCRDSSEVYDKETGYCRSGCTAGKHGHGCQQDCQDGTFGLACSKVCQCDAVQEACNKKTGHCISGCTSGKQGHDCQTDCVDGTFFRNCNKHCWCFKPEKPCDKKTGHCESGCTAGKTADDCQTNCLDGRFGPNCNQTCYCAATNDVCDKKTGDCVSGCAPGKVGNDCQDDCKDGSFGFNCTNYCLCVNVDEICNKMTGHCVSGCTAGKHGEDCQTDCGDYTYGENCMNVCNCLNQCEMCNKVTGACNTGYRTTLAPVTFPTASNEERNVTYLTVLGSLLGATSIAITVLSLVNASLKKQVSQYKAEIEERYSSLRDRTDSRIYDVVTETNSSEDYVNVEVNRV